MAHGEGFCLALGEYSDAIPLCREDMTQCRTNGRIKRRPIKKAIEAAGAGSRRIKRKRGRILGGRIFSYKLVSGRLITLPLFICFFNAFRYWGHEQMVELLLTANSDMDAAKEMFLSFKFLWVNNIWQADNGMSPVIMGAQSFLQTADLPRLLLFKSNPEMLTVFENLGMAVRSSLVVDGEVQTVWNFIASQGAIAKYNELTAPLSELYAGYNNGWFLLPLLAGGSMFLASKLTQPNQKAAGQPASQQQQSGKMMMYIFPVISFIACLSNNAAFAIYWLLSNVIMIAINLILNKKYPRVAIADVKGGK